MSTRTAVFTLITGAMLLDKAELAFAAPESEHGRAKEHAAGPKPEHVGPKDKGPPGFAPKDDERHQRLLARFEERKRTASQRRQAERDEGRRKWGAAIDHAPARNELKRHARTVARLERVKDVAEAAGKTETAARAAALLEKENARHEKRMAALSAAPAAPSASGGSQ